MTRSILHTGNWQTESRNLLPVAYCFNMIKDTNKGRISDGAAE